MDQAEAQRRNQLLRQFFEGKDWDRSEAYQLKRELVLRSSELLPDFPLLIDDQWEVQTGKPGRGDLIFADLEGNYAVVEVRHLEQDRPSRAPRGGARSGIPTPRSQMVEAARRHAMAVASWDDVDIALAFTYSSDDHDHVMPVGRYQRRA